MPALVVTSNICQVMRTWKNPILREAWRDDEQVIEDINVYSCRQLMIPANSTITVLGRMGVKRVVDAGVIERGDGLLAGLAVPSTVVPSNRDYKVSVVLTNVLGRPIDTSATEDCLSSLCRGIDST